MENNEQIIKLKEELRMMVSSHFSDALYYSMIGHELDDRLKKCPKGTYVEIEVQIKHDDLFGSIDDFYSTYRANKAVKTVYLTDNKQQAKRAAKELVNEVASNYQTKGQVD